jgi:uncharacterized protein YneF (UPF0154 family)
MIVLALVCFVYGFAFGNAKMMERVKDKNPELHKELVEDTKQWWNSLLDGFKAKTKEQKITELKKEIEELEHDE